MSRLLDVPWKFEVAEEKTSHFIELDHGIADIILEVRAQKGCVVNGVTAEGETVFLGYGSVLVINERVAGYKAIEMEAEGQLAYRCVVAPVIAEEVLDPRPATVVERLTEADTVAILVREEVERRLRELGTMNVLKEEIDVDELMEDVLKGDHEFDEEEDDFVSSSYEDLAEEPERFDQRPGRPPPGPPPGLSPGPVSATSGGSGGGNEPPDLPAEGVDPVAHT